MANLSEFTTFAHQLADAAGAVIRPYFGVAVDVDTKADNSPVSIADREAEAAIRTLIEKHYPNHGIFGEEFGISDSSLVALHGTADGVSTAKAENASSTKSYTWVIDPIDGTRAFLAGKKEWGTLIALCENGVPILGILDQPVTGERWVGTKGNPTTHNNVTVTTRACANIRAAEISATYCAPPDDSRFDALAARAGTRILAGDCYAYGLLASGQRDIVCDTSLKPYDILALVPIIAGAGGIITSWDGAPLTLTNYSQALAAGDVKIHNETLEFLRKQG